MGREGKAGMVVQEGREAMEGMEDMEAMVGTSSYVIPVVSCLASFKF